MAGEKILIIEDNDKQRLLYREELEALGYSVIEAANAVEGLRMVEEEQPNLVILDICMPGIDGLEALTRIHNINPTLPVVINTAYSSYQDQFISWLADAYVVKSSNVDELLETVQKVLRERSGE
ncbi:MAG: response regulator [Armatimonadota bacterium]|nr:response regulator [Armatimonadota bacterium]MCX7777290.1 response regulator [Armatimonadota bacterium]MDW8024393.1 response regulator [Armatimonadota bacterium]